ncbi:hypothetical protein K439DRAFT_1622743 [Ramaria rubella]|nr:hypothetical protein K439DRAFT_1622743 [Ramaria rubella]
MPATPTAFLALLAPSMHLNTPPRLMGTTAAMLSPLPLCAHYRRPPGSLCALCAVLPPSWPPPCLLCSPTALLAPPLSSTALLSPSMHPATLLGPTAPSGHSHRPACPIPALCAPLPPS